MRSDRPRPTPTARPSPAHVELNQILADECARARDAASTWAPLFNGQFTASDFATTDFFHPSRAGPGAAGRRTWAAASGPTSRPRRSSSSARPAARPQVRPTASPSSGHGHGGRHRPTNGTAYEYGVWVERGGRLSAPVRGTASPSEFVNYSVTPTATSRTRPPASTWASSSTSPGEVLLSLGRVYKLGSTAANKIGIWEDATHAARLRGVQPPNPVVGLSTPLALQAGKRYVFGIQEAVGTPWSGGRPSAGCRPSSWSTTPSTTAPGLLLPGSARRPDSAHQARRGLDDTFGRRTAGAALLDPVTDSLAAAGTGWSGSRGQIRRLRSRRCHRAEGRCAAGGPRRRRPRLRRHRYVVTDTGLTNGTHYLYAAWVQRGGDISVLRGSTTPTGSSRLRWNPQAIRATLGSTSPGRTRRAPSTGSGWSARRGRAADPDDGTVVYTGCGHLLRRRRGDQRHALLLRGLGGARLRALGGQADEHDAGRTAPQSRRQRARRGGGRAGEPVVDESGVVRRRQGRAQARRRAARSSGRHTRLPGRGETLRSTRG